VNISTALTDHFRETFLTVMKYEICARFGFCAASIGLFLTTFRHNLSVPSSRFKLTLYPLKLGQIDCPLMSVRNQHSALRKISKRARMSFTPRRQPEVTHGNDVSLKVNCVIKCEYRGIWVLFSLVYLKLVPQRVPAIHVPWRVLSYGYCARRIKKLNYCVCGKI
jgi:hypothetical protein